MYSNYYSSYSQQQQENSKSYYCHQCQNHFVRQIIESDPPQSIECNVCQSDFCEEINENDQLETRQTPAINLHPFMPNIRRTPISIRRILSNGQMVFEIRNLVRIPSYSQTSHVNNPFDNHFQQILNHLLLNDPNKHGAPPASKASVENLEGFSLSKSQLVEYKEKECAICKEIFLETEQLKRMPCKHDFHHSCLITWLSEHNSCPICRFELETEDPDYEQRKKSN